MSPLAVLVIQGAVCLYKPILFLNLHEENEQNYILY
jgi:hypothetical protein